MLYAALRSPEQPGEADFVDRVVRNLRRGRALILIAGDGIRSETELFLSGIHDYARFDFSLALIELAVFKMLGSAQFIVRPRTIAKTEIVKRHVIRVDGALSAESQPEPEPPQPKTITSQVYWEAIERSVPGSRARLEELIAAASQFGVYPEFLRSLNLKWNRPGEERAVNLGYMHRDGTVQTDAASWFAPRQLAREYVAAVCRAFECDSRELGEGASWNPFLAGRRLNLRSVLDRLPLWVPEMERFIRAIQRYDLGEPVEMLPSAESVTGPSS